MKLNVEHGEMVGGAVDKVRWVEKFLAEGR